MAEPREIKISVEFSIESTEHVQVEFRRDPVAVVIGGHQSRLIFHHVDSQQQRIARLQLTGQIAKNRSRLVGCEVADA